jgi:quercetin dioxygenase-like cupin family protein
MKVPLALLLLASAAPASDVAVPAAQDPEHHLVLENEFVQAFRVTLPPGKSTGMHVHAYDDAAVRLSETTIRLDAPGKPAATEQVHVGVATARANEKTPYTHRVNNVGSAPFDVIDVQVLRRPEGPEAPALGPVAAENPRQRVYRYELAPKASSAMHSHNRPYVIVAATDMALRMSSPDGRVMAHPIKAGDVHWVNPPVTHTLTNDGTEKGILVEIELK